MLNKLRDAVRKRPVLALVLAALVGPMVVSLVLAIPIGIYRYFKGQAAAPALPAAAAQS